MDRLFNLSPEYVDNLITSLSNLAVLKLLHQNGVYVKDYPDYRAILEYSQDEGPYIAESGISKLFESECSIVGMYCIETEEENEILNELVNDGYVRYSPEFCFFIPLDKYKLFLIRQKNLVQFEELLFRLNKQNENGFQYIYLRERGLLVITMDYEGDFHVIVNGAVSVWKELEKMEY